MKIIAYSVIFLLVAGIVMAADMSRSMPDKVSPGDTITVSFSVSGMEIGKQVAISEVLPSGWSISSWVASGAKEEKSAIAYAKKSTGEYQWSFTASSETPSLSYTLKVPSSALGTYNFDAVYVLPPANMNNLKKSLIVRVIKCGDGVCEGSENSDNCVADCPKPAEQPAQQPVQQQTPVVIKEDETGKSGFTSKTMIISLIIVVIIITAVLGLWAYKKHKRRNRIEQMIAHGSPHHRK